MDHLTKFDAFTLNIDQSMDQLRHVSKSINEVLPYGFLGNTASCDVVGGVVWKVERVRNWFGSTLVIF